MANLLEDNNKVALATRACTEPIRSFANFLSLELLGPGVVAVVSRPLWEKCRSSEIAFDPNYFDYLVRKLRLVDALDLASAPARNHLVGRRARTWSGGSMGMTDFARIIQFGGASVVGPLILRMK